MVLARTIALRTLLGRPGRTFFSVLGIAVGIATVVGIFTLDHNTPLGRTRCILYHVAIYARREDEDSFATHSQYCR